MKAEQLQKYEDLVDAIVGELEANIEESMRFAVATRITTVLTSRATSLLASKQSELERMQINFKEAQSLGKDDYLSKCVEKAEKEADEKREQPAYEMEPI